MNSRGARFGRCYAGRAPGRLAGAFPMTKIKFPLLLAARCGPPRRVRRRRWRAKLAASDVAVVGATHVSKSAFDALIVQAKRSYATQTGPKAFPKPGTTEYATIKGQAVTLLVQQAEREEKATSMGIKITDAARPEAARPDQEAVLRWQRDEVPGAAEEAAADRRPGPHRHAPAADLRSRVRRR